MIAIGPDQLETFLAVAEAGSFRRAAERLQVSQPSVTTRIQRLEATLGVKLFNRTTRQVSMTEAGERLRGQAEQTVCELRSMVDEMRDEAVLKRGKVSLAVSPTVAATVLPPILRRFARRRPGVVFTLRDQFVAQDLEWLAAGEVDMALIPHDGKGREVAFEPLFRDEFLVVLPRGHRAARGGGELDFAEFARHPLLMLPPESAVWGMMERAFASHRLRFEPKYQARNLFTLLGMVEAGLGVTLLPEIIRPRLNVSTVETMRLRDADISRTIGIATIRGRSLTAAAESFAQALRVGLRRGGPDRPIGKDY